MTIVDAPDSGTTDIDPDTGVVTYTPDPDFSGTDTFTYTVLDNDGAVSNEATVSINVGAVNDAPTAVDDPDFTTAEDTPVDIPVLDNDSDLDGTLDPTTVTIVDAPDSGTTDIDPDTGVVTYTPDPDFSGTDTFTYTVLDNDGAVSNEATVSINVGAVNDAPTAVDDPDFTTAEDTPVDIPVLDNDSDLDGTLDPTTVTIVDAPDSGTTDIDPDTGVVTYTPDPDFSGTDTFTYTVLDNDGAVSNEATVSINVGAVNDAPTAVDDPDFTTAEDTPVDIPVLDNDSDLDGTLDPTTVTIVDAPDSGTTDIDPDTGVVTYTPDPDFSGTDTFTYTVLDNDGAVSNEATVSINVGAVNDAPTAVDDPDFTTAEDTPVDIPVLDNDSDLDGTLDPTTVTIVDAPDSGTTDIDPDTGVVTYTPDPDFSGTDTFTYTVLDNDGAVSNEATVSINVGAVNDAPTAVDDPDFTTAEDTPVDIPVLDNDSDLDGTLDPTTVTIVDAPDSGTTDIDPDTGVVTYTPDPDFSGTDTFTYTVLDNDGAVSNEATVSINVGAVNDAPTAVDDPDFTTAEDTPVDIPVLDNDSDLDGTLDPTTVTIVDAPDSGTTDIDPDTGVVTYTPDPDFSGTDTFTYTVLDNDGAVSNEATVSINVGAVNDAPTAVDDPDFTTAEDTPVDIPVLDNDSDLDGTLDPTTVTIVDAPDSGTTDIDPDTGVVTYTPDPDFSGTDTFTYTVLDNDGAVSNEATVSINVGAVNDAPTAVDDPDFTTAEDTPVDIPVLDNDSDLDGTLDPTTVTIVDAPDSGTTDIDPDTGVVTYTPDPDFSGTDTFTYTVLDNDGAVSNEATVSINVGAVNDAPTAVDDPDFTTAEDTPVDIPVLDNDSDLDGTLDPTTVTIVDAPDSGTTDIDPDTGVVTYTPDPDFSGTDTFTYTVLDNDGAVSNEATVSINVGAVNDAPTAVDDPDFTTAEDTPVDIPVLDNDSDLDGTLDPTTVTIVDAPDSGTTDIDPDTGVVTYTPDPDFSGTDTFTYTVLDNDGAVSNEATVSINVGAVNDAPTAVDDPDFTTAEDTPVDIPVLDNDSDLDGTLDPTTVTIVDAPDSGTTDIDPDTGVVTYTPDPDFSGTDTFTYTVLDNDGAVSNEATVSINVGAVNDAPTAVDDPDFTTAEDTPVDIPVLDNDSDLDGTLDPTTVTIVDAPDSGTTDIDPDTGVVTYTPDPDFSGTDTFTYTVLDNDGAVSNEATVSINVGAVNDAPTAVDDPDFTTAEDTPVDIPVLDNDSDLDGTLDPTTVTIVDAPDSGTTDIDPDTGVVTYTPDPDFSGTDTFTYTVLDNDGAVSNEATVSINVGAVNDAPTAVDDPDFTTAEDTPVDIPVLDNDSDLDGTLDPTTVTIVDAPDSGTTDIDPDTGVVTYTPDPDFSGTDTFTYTVLDNDGAVSNEATVSINVGAVNDAPTAVDDPDFTTAEDTPVDIPVLDNDSDLDGTLDPTTVTIVDAPDSGTTDIDPDTGVVTYTPDPDFSGTDTFTYTVLDNDGAVSNEATVSINVGAVNDAPTAVDDPDFTTAEDTPVDIPVLDNDSDLDGTLDPTTVTIVDAPDSGTTDIDPDTGVVTYTPDPDFSGTDTFTYTVLDNDGAVSNEATVSINVGAVNDAPTAVDDPDFTTAEDTPVDIPVLDNDSDLDGTLDPTTVTIVDAPDSGTTDIDPDTGVVTYTPDPDFSGTDTFTYTVLDNDGAVSNEATVSINVGAVNDAPTAVDDPDFTTAEDTPVDIPVLDNDSDLDGTLDPTTVTIVDAPDSGTTDIDPDTGVVTYTPDPDFSGTDTFTYTVLDNDGAVSNEATVSINVGAVNDAPTAVDDGPFTTQEGESITLYEYHWRLGILDNDTDLDFGDQLNLIGVGDPTNGTVSLEQIPNLEEPGYFDDGLIYTPNDGFFGQDTFTYTVEDSAGETDIGNVTIIVNGKPDAVDDVVPTNENTAITINVLANDTDPDGDSVSINRSIASISAPSNGTAFLNPDDTVTYTPDADFNGLDSFTYIITDGNGGNDTATVTVNVGAVSNVRLDGDEFRVNISTTHYQQNATIAALSEGGFVVVWESALGSDIFGRIYNNDTSAVTGEFNISSIQVNRPAVTGLTDERFLVTWDSGGDVFGQIFDATGNSITGDLQINFTSDGSQIYSSATGFEDGSFVVVWQSDGNDLDDDDQNGIFGRKYSADGTPGAEFHISAETVDDQRNPVVTALDDGAFLVAWESANQLPDGDSYGIFARIFDANLTPGTEFVLNEFTANSQDSPQIVALRDGGFATTWNSYDINQGGVFYQIFDDTGTPLLDEEMPVASYTTGIQAFPVIDALPDGGFMIAWQSSSDGGITGGNGNGVIGQLFRADGSRNGDNFLINTTLTHDQDTPDIAVLSDGTVVSVWQSWEQDGGFYDDIFGKRIIIDYNPGVNDAPTDIMLDGYSVDENSSSAVVGTLNVFDPDPDPGTHSFDIIQGYGANFSINNDTNELILVTPVDFENPPAELSVRVLATDDSDGSVTFAKTLYLSINDLDEVRPVGGEFLINVPAPNFQQKPDVASLTNSNYVAVWGSGGSGIKGQIYDAGSSPIGSEFTISTTDGWKGWPSITALPDLSETGGGPYADGGFVVVWERHESYGVNQSVYGQILDAQGNAIGSEFEVTAMGAPDTRPSVSSLPDGSFVVAWTSNTEDGSDSNVWAKIYDGTGLESELLVNETTLLAQGFASVSGLANGDFITTWESDGGDSDLYAVYGRIYDSSEGIFLSEFQVNQFEESYQHTPAVTLLNNGDFIVTWSSVTQDGSYNTAMGRLYDENGTPKGGEFQLNTYTTDSQKYTDVAALDDGGFVTIWQSWGQDGSEWGMYGQAYDDSGNKIGTEFQINSSTDLAQEQGAVIGLSDGSFVATWQSYHQEVDSTNVYGQHFVIDRAGEEDPFNIYLSTTLIDEGLAANATIAGIHGLDPDWGDSEMLTFSVVGTESLGGTFSIINNNQLRIAEVFDASSPPDDLYVTIRATDPTGRSVDKRFDFTIDETGPKPFGDEFQINSYTTGDQTLPSITALQDGGFVVTWQSATDWGVGLESFGQRYDSGGNKVGGEFLINYYGNDDQNRPVVAGLAGGGFVVAWHSENQEGNAFEVYGKIYDTNGAPSTGEFRINSYTDSNQDIPAITALDDGRFVVTWSSNDQDLDSLGIFGQVFNADGSIAIPEFQVNSHTVSYQDMSSVSGLTDNGFVVVWETPGYELPDMDGTAIYARIFGPDGTPNPSDILINKTHVIGNQNYADVTGLSDGNILVTWGSATGDGDGYGVFGKILDSNGNTVYGEFSVNSTTALDQYLPAIDSFDGGFIVTWTNVGDIHGQVYSNNGSTIGTEFTVNSTTDSHQKASTVAVLPDGSFVVSWMSRYDGDGDSWGIFGQRFVIDTPGNDAPEDIYLSSDYIWEDWGPQIIGQFTTFDVDNGDSFSYRIVESAGGSFSLVNNTLFLDSPLDSETFSGPLYVKVEAADSGGQILQETFNLQLKDIGTWKVGNEIQVNTWTDSDQTKPQVTANQWGGYFVIWQSFDQDENARGIYGQQFGDDGSPLGQEFRINADGTENESYPLIAGLAGGGFVAAWLVNGTSIEGRVFDGNGDPLTSDFIIASDIDGTYGPTIAPLDDGNFVVGWSQANANDSLDDLVLQRYDNSGTAIGSQVTVDTLAPGVPMNISVSNMADGGFIVAWNDENSFWDIYTQRYDSDGNTIGDQTLVSGETTISHDGNPAVLGLSDGGYAVVWESLNGSNIDIIGQIFGSDGNSRSPEFRINTSADDELNRAEPVLIESDGSIVVAWEVPDQDGNGLGVFGQAVDIYDGMLIGEEFQIHSNNIGEQSSVALSPVWGGFVATWQTTDSSGTDTDGFSIASQRFIIDHGWDEYPSLAVLSNYDVNEELPVGTKVADIFALDADQGDVLSYTLDGPDAGYFQIDGNELLTAEVFDYEARNWYDLAITATDQTGRSNTQTWWIAVNDVEEVLPTQTFALSTAITNGSVEYFTTEQLSNGDYLVAWNERPGDTSPSQLAAMVYDADGDPVTDLPLVIHESTDGFQNATVAALGGSTGEFVILWEGPDDTNGGIWTWFGQTFDYNGDTTNGPFIIDNTMEPNQQFPVIHGIDSDSFVVAWTTGGSGNDYLQTFTYDDTASTYIADSTPKKFHESGSAITWFNEIVDYPTYGDNASFLIGGNNGVGSTVQLFDSSGEPIGGPFYDSYNQPHAAADQTLSDFITLESGHSVIYNIDWQGDGSVDLRLDIQRPNGNLLESTVAHTFATPPDWNHVSLTELSGSNFAVSWIEDGSISTNYYYLDPDQSSSVGPPTALYVDATISKNTSGEVLGVIAGQDGDDLSLTYSIKDGSHPHFGIEGNLLILHTPFDEIIDGIPPDLDLTIVATDSDSYSLEKDITVKIQQNVVLSGEYPMGDLIPPSDSIDDITSYGSGNYVTTWSADDGSGMDVYAKLYSSKNFSISGPFIVNSTTAGTQDQAAVVGLDSGGFLITYNSVDTDRDILGKIYDANGDLAVDEFAVNTSTTGNQERAVAASLNTGGFVVAWASDETGDTDLRYRIFDTDGNEVSAEQTVNEATIGQQYNADIASLENGDFIVTWTSDPQPGDNTSIYARIFDNSGAPVTSEFSVNSDAASWADESMFDARVIGLSDGGFVVAWDNSTSGDTDPWNNWVYLAQYDYDGSTVSLELANTLASVTEDPVLDRYEGGFVLGYENVFGTLSDPDNTPAYSVRALIIDDSGNLVAHAVQPSPDADIDWNLNQVNNTSTVQDVMALPGGRFVVITGNEDGNVVTAPNIFYEFIVDTPFVEQASWVSLDTPLASEDLSIGSVIGSLHVIDPDAGDTHGLSLIDDASGLFSLSGNNLILDQTLDFETAQYHNIVVQVTGNEDGIVSDHSVTVNVGNVFEPGEYELVAGFWPEMDYTVDNDYPLITAAGLTPVTASLNISPDYLPYGGYVIVDVSDDSNVLRARIYDDGGEEVVPSFPIADHSDEDTIIVSSPSATSLLQDDGVFVVSWTEYNNSTGSTQSFVMGYYPDGSKVESSTSGGTQEPVPFYSSNTLSDPQQSVTVVNGDGDFVLTWVEQSVGSSDSDIWYRFFDTDIGDFPEASVLVNQETAGNQQSPALAVSSSGDGIFVWQDDSGLDEDGSAIYARYYDYDETAGTHSFGNQFLVNQTTSGNQSTPKVAIDDATGTFMVSWTDTSDSGSNVYARVYEQNPVITPLSEYPNEIALTDSSFGLNNQGIVAANGGYLVYWISENDTDYGIRGQLFYKDGDNYNFTDIFGLTPFESDVANASVSYLTDNPGGLAVTWEGTTRDLNDTSHIFRANLSIIARAEGDGDDNPIDHSTIDISSMLFGRGGNDILTGGPEDDIIKGGEGTDTMYGGDNNDVFVIWGIFDANVYEDNPLTLIDESLDPAGESLLGGNTVSHWATDEFIDGGDGDNDTIVTYGEFDPSVFIDGSPPTAEPGAGTIINVENLVMHSEVTLHTSQLADFGFTSISGDGDEPHILNLVGEGTVDLTGIAIDNIDEINIDQGVELVLTEEQEATLNINMVENPIEKELGEADRIQTESAEDNGPAQAVADSESGDEPLFGDDLDSLLDKENAPAEPIDIAGAVTLFGDNPEEEAGIESDLVAVDDEDTQTGTSGESIFGDSGTGSDSTDTYLPEPLLTDTGEDVSMDVTIEQPLLTADDLAVEPDTDTALLWLDSQVDDVDTAA